MRPARERGLPVALFPTPVPGCFRASGLLKGPHRSGKWSPRAHHRQAHHDPLPKKAIATNQHSALESRGAIPFGAANGTARLAGGATSELQQRRLTAAVKHLRALSASEVCDHGQQIQCTHFTPRRSKSLHNATPTPRRPDPAPCPVPHAMHPQRNVVCSAGNINQLNVCNPRLALLHTPRCSCRALGPSPCFR